MNEFWSLDGGGGLSKRFCQAGGQGSLTGSRGIEMDTVRALGDSAD